MLRRALSRATCAVAAGTVLAACSPAPAPTSSARAATPTPVPVPSGPPFAVVTTNDAGTGSSYTVMLINDRARIVAQATAQLPTPKPNQLEFYPLASASNTTVYYRNGDTAIWSLSPTGATGSVMAIPAGSSQVVGFAVSPDGQGIAIVELTEQLDPSGDASQGYIEDLSTGTGVVSLWNSTGSTHALRSPAGWYGTSLIEQIETFACDTPGCVNGVSYQVVDPTTGATTETVCENPATQTASPGGTETYYSPDGLPTPAGVACLERTDSLDQTGQIDGAKYTMESISWSGQARTFAQASIGNQPSAGQGLPVQNCYLSADGSRMACAATSNQALTFVSSSGTLTNTDRTYKSILGWIDSSHLLVDVDSGDLGVVDATTGDVTILAVTEANEVEMTGTLPESP